MNWGCKNKLEIKSLPKTVSEILLSELEKIKALITPENGKIAHRVSLSNSPTKNYTIVQFVHRMTRDIRIENSHEKRYTSSDLDFGSATDAWVNEQLCPELKRLLGRLYRKRKTPTVSLSKSGMDSYSLGKLRNLAY